MAVEPGRGKPAEPAHGAVPVYGALTSDRIARMRAGDADRERATDVLKAAFAEGRLTKDEYDQRVAHACASRTYGELAAITDDLPVGPLGALALGQVMVPQRPPMNRRAIAALVCGLLPTPVTSVLAISLATGARQEIKKTGERGMAAADAGFALGLFFSVVMAIWFFAVLLAMAAAGGG
jgi:uncharacterized membrane protein